MVILSVTACPYGLPDPGGHQHQQDPADRKHLEHGTYRWILWEAERTPIYPGTALQAGIISAAVRARGWRSGRGTRCPRSCTTQGQQNSPPSSCSPGPEHHPFQPPEEGAEAGPGASAGRQESRQETESVGGVLRLMEQTRMGLAGYDPAEDDREVSLWPRSRFQV